MSVVGLERALLQYCSQPNEQPFDMKTVPIETAPIGERPICKHLYVVVQFRSVHTHRRSYRYMVLDHKRVMIYLLAWSNCLEEVA